MSEDSFKPIDRDEAPAEADSPAETGPDEGSQAKGLGDPAAVSAGHGEVQAAAGVSLAAKGDAPSEGPAAPGLSEPAIVAPGPDEALAGRLSALTEALKEPGQALKGRLSDLAAASPGQAEVLAKKFANFTTSKGASETQWGKLDEILAAREGTEEAPGPEPAEEPVDEAPTELPDREEHKNPKYRGLYLIGPLPELRGAIQEGLTLMVMENPYPSELEDAIAERAEALSLLGIRKRGLGDKEEKGEETGRLLKVLSSLERRLALRWERLRVEHLKIAKAQGHGWREYLDSLNVRYRFVARRVLAIKNVLDRAAQAGPRNVARLLVKTLKETKNSFPDLPELAQGDDPNPKRAAAAVKEAERILAALEAERLMVLDKILVVEDLLSQAREEGWTLFEAPEPVEAPRLIAEADLTAAQVESRPLKALTGVTVALLILALAYAFLARGRNPAPPPLPGRLLATNGLGTSVDVFYDEGKSFVLGPGEAVVVHLPLSPATRKLEAFLTDGPFIEAVEVNPPGKDRLESTAVYNVAGAAPLVALMGQADQPEYLVKSSRLPLGAPKVSYTLANVFVSLPKKSDAPLRLWGPPERAKALTGLGAISGLDPDSVRRALKSGQTKTDGSDPTYKNLLLNQCLYNPEWDEWTPLWLLRLSQLYPKEAKEAFQERLRHYPNDQASRKFLFDLSDELAKGELCQDTLARVALEQDRVFDQYLLTFCLPAAERLPHLKENMERFPNSHVLSSALGRVEFDRGDYLRAFEIWEEVLRVDPMSLVFEMDNLARLERRIGRTGFEIYDDVNAWVPAVAKKAVYELGVDPNERERELGQEKAYFFMANGRLIEAVNRATGDFRDRILPLLAASEGSDPALLAEFLAAPPEKGLNADNAWTRLAILILAGRDGQKVEEFILSQAVDRGLVEKIIQSVKNREMKKTEELIAGLGARQQGQACLAAYLVAADPAAAEECRNKAKGFLFSSERPYLK
ncbi:MAG: hypothetical protein LBE01_01395 [Deltaproteobacteria bacterium]|jgi:tetratricopeptide (TPR) repeat protein|nr:hypothetical protein [Deltaproteobacteria bacterium]